MNQVTPKTKTIPIYCSCCGTKKAAEVHVGKDLTIVFGHGRKRKHIVVIDAAKLLRLVMGAEDVI